MLRDGGLIAHVCVCVCVCVCDMGEGGTSCCIQVLYTSGLHHSTVPMVVNSTRMQMEKGVDFTSISVKLQAVAVLPLVKYFN